MKEIYVQLAALKKFWERLADEESREIMDSYITSVLCENDSRESFLKTIYDKIWKYDLFPDHDFGKFMEGRDKNKIIIFGAGHDGRLVKRMLEMSGMPPYAFCDNAGGGMVDGLKILLPECLRNNYHDYVVVLASRNYWVEFLNQLVSMFFPQENIYYPREGILRVGVGWQYFGLPYFKPVQDEVFLDCGCFDGGSVFDFIKWCNGNYKKIYSFEPDSVSYLKCKENLAGLERVELKNIGLWNESAVLRFSVRQRGGSRISAEGQEEISVQSIDDILKGEPVTFIKMDIEGAELNALRGAESVIKTYYPKLAICLYHKWLDLIEIPAFLVNIAPEYHFAIRHHTSRFGEMVLYAWR